MEARATLAPRSEDGEGRRIRAFLGCALGLVADPLVVPSFDRTGFRIHSLAFRPDDLDVDLSGRRCLVTGANAGIGFEIARMLAALGAEVGLLCRDAGRGARAARRVQRATGNPRVFAEPVDVSDLEAVRASAARLAAGAVDVLIHNAGVLPDARTETRQGLELTFATHVAGPFLLTRLLLPSLAASADGRVVWVSSGGMYARRLRTDDPNWTHRAWDGVAAYAETKRAQVVLSELFAERLRGTSVKVNAMHPGWAETPGVRRSLPRFHRVMRPLLRTPAEGADTAVWLAASPRAAAWRGRFFLDRAPRRTHLLPRTRETEEERRRLWSLCERVTAGCAAPSLESECR